MKVNHWGVYIKEEGKVLCVLYFGLTIYFFGIDFNLSVDFLATLLCIAFIIVALNTTIHILKFSVCLEFTSYHFIEIYKLSYL